MAVTRFIEYRLPPHLSIDELCQKLAAQLVYRGRGHLKRIFLDSFDRRLHRAELTLAVQESDGHADLVCRKSSDSSVLASIPWQRPPPRFAGDLNVLDRKPRWSKLLGVRALLPLVTLDCNAHSYEHPDGALRLWLGDTWSHILGREDAQPIGAWLFLEVDSEAMAFLAPTTTLSACIQDLQPVDSLNHALNALDRNPEPGEGMPEPPLSADQRADAAVKGILLKQLALIEANEPGVLARWDSEFLHDFRVAVRRTRSLLGQIKGIFPAKVVRQYGAAFAWLGQITGEPRDLDVYVPGFDQLKARLPKALREDLEPLRAELSERLDQTYRRLHRQLAIRRYRRVLTSWRAYLEQPVPRRPSAPHARLPFKQVAAARIRKLFRRAVRQGRAIDEDTPAEQLHELRKTCKKLRYLIEASQELYPDDAIRPAIRQLKQLQEYLGEYQDIHTQIAWLQALADGLRDRPEIPTRTLLAMGALQGILERRQEKLRADLPHRFKAFGGKEARTHFQALFRDR